MTRMHTGVIPLTGRMAINDCSNKDDWEAANFDAIVATLAKEATGFSTIHDIPDPTKRESTLKTVNKQLCRWFKQYLKNQNGSVWVNGCASTLTCNVPQDPVAVLCNVCAKKIEANLLAILRTNQLVAKNPDSPLGTYSSLKMAALTQRYPTCMALAKVAAKATDSQSEQSVGVPPPAQAGYVAQPLVDAGTASKEPPCDLSQEPTIAPVHGSLPTATSVAPQPNIVTSPPPVQHSWRTPPPTVEEPVHQAEAPCPTMAMVHAAGVVTYNQGTGTFTVQENAPEAMLKWAVANLMNKTCFRAPTTSVSQMPPPPPRAYTGSQEILRFWNEVGNSSSLSHGEVQQHPTLHPLNQTSETVVRLTPGPRRALHSSPASTAVLQPIVAETPVVATGHAEANGIAASGVTPCNESSQPTVTPLQVTPPKEASASSLLPIHTTTAPGHEDTGEQITEYERQKNRNIQRNLEAFRQHMQPRHLNYHVEDLSALGIKKKIDDLDTARLTAHMRKLLEAGNLKSITAHKVLLTLTMPDTYHRYRDLQNPLKESVMKQLDNLLTKLVDSTPALAAIKAEVKTRMTNSAQSVAPPRRSNRSTSEDASSTARARKVRKVQSAEVTVTGSTMNQLVPKIRELVVARAKADNIQLQAETFRTKSTKSLVNSIAGRCRGQKWEDITYGQDFHFQYDAPGNVWRGQIGRSVHVVAIPSWKCDNYYCTVVAHDTGANLSIGLPAVYLDFATFHAEFDAHPFNSSVVKSYKPRRVLNVHACEKGLLWNTATGEAFDMTNLPRLLANSETVPEFLRNVEFHDPADKIA